MIPWQNSLSWAVGRWLSAVAGLNKRCRAVIFAKVRAHKTVQSAI